MERRENSSLKALEVRAQTKLTLVAEVEEGSSNSTFKIISPTLVESLRQEEKQKKIAQVVVEVEAQYRSSLMYLEVTELYMQLEVLALRKTQAVVLEVEFPSDSGTQ